MASYKMWQLWRDALGRTKLLTYGRATGGSTTTIIDTNIPAGGRDERYTNGTALVLRDAGGASAAPEGEFSRITSYASSSNTFTLASTLTAAVASGDRYGVMTNTINHEELIELTNDALQIFDVPLIDTSITSASAQTEYTLPVALKQHDLLKVEYVGNTSDANDQQWQEVTSWEIVPSSPGSTATLILPQLPDSRTVRLWYKDKHPRLESFSSYVSELIDPMLARAAMVERIRNREVERTLGSARPQRTVYDKAKAELEEAIINYPVVFPPQRAEMPNYSLHAYNQSPATPNLVRL